MPQKSQPATKPDEQLKALKESVRRRMSEVKRKLLVLSGKGGVGKSTVAANLAAALAREGNKVGLLDVDVHGPSIPQLMGLQNARLVADDDGIHPVNAGENLKVISIGLMLAARSDPVIWRGPLKFNVIRQFLGDANWGQLDYLVVDSPPGTGDEPLSVAQLIGDDASAVLVTTPQALAVADVRRCVSFCNVLELPILGIVENMSSLRCPHCGGYIDLFATGGGQTLAEETNLPLLGSIPLDPGVVAGGDAGELFVRTDPDGPVAVAFRKIVSAVRKEKHK